MNEQLAAIRTRRAAITPEQMRELRFMANCHNKAPMWSEFNRQAVANVLAAPGDVDTLLAMVEQRDARIDALMAMWQANTDALAAVTAEREALREQLQQAQRELAGGKPEPTQQENDAAQERLRQMDALYMRHGSNTRTWPDYALSAYTRLMAAQTEYEAKYC